MTAMMESATTIYEGMSKSEEYSAMIKAQGDLMKKTLRQYQTAKFTHEEAFQLVLAQVANGDFKISG